jgi:nucleotide-binding universal stress UspA family protein
LKERAILIFENIIKSKNLITTNQDETKTFSIRLEVLFDNPAEKIIEFANNEKTGVIVMGIVGLSGLSRLKIFG